MHSKQLTTTILSFEPLADASGAPALVEVRYGHQAARFACDMLGGATVNCLGSGLSVRMTSKAADAARRLYSHRVVELGVAWLAENRAMYSEGE